ncbi:MAG TPA: hypothetical protein VK638_20895 [Edaphobacter sp.]|nr:hypothetical protein [Edaphobacter sp.]
MKYINRCLLALAAAVIVMLSVGCSSGTGNNPNPPASISVSFASQPASSLQISNTINLTANVTNDSSNGGVK